MPSDSFTPNGKSKSSQKSTTHEDYFATNPAPATLKSYIAQTRSFIAQHNISSVSRPIVLLTSGGTTVPLENQTVRFIDNFSAGTRGATSAEYFLTAGYAVIFLHRQYSLLPYSRHYSHSTNCFLDYMDVEDKIDNDTVNRNAGTDAAKGGRVVVKPEYQAKMQRVAREYIRSKRQNTLLLLSFTTINEYLWLLRGIATELRPLGARALFYLAAAVSDFFVPAERMVEHKIQSGEESHQKANVNGEGGTRGEAAHMRNNSLIIDLDPVPKFLKQLVDGWAPSAMIVSFKLETDPSILVRKARQALDKYAHHLVIGNILKTRKMEVVFVGREVNVKEMWIRVEDEAEEIEGKIIPEVKRLHERFVECKTEDGV